MSEIQVLQSLYTAELCNRNTFYGFLHWGQNEILPSEANFSIYSLILLKNKKNQYSYRFFFLGVLGQNVPNKIEMHGSIVHPNCLPPPLGKFKQHLQAKLSVVDKIQNAGLPKLCILSRNMKCPHRVQGINQDRIEPHHLEAYF